MKSKMPNLSFLIGGLLILAVACGSPDFLTPTPSPTRVSFIVPSPTSTQIPASTPLPVADAVVEPKRFLKKENLIAAYCNADSNDEVFTPFLFAGQNIAQSSFPRIQSAIFSRKGQILKVFGPDARATLVGNLIFGPSYISTASAKSFVSPESLSPEDRSMIFPKDYNLLPPQEKINLLFKEIVSKSKEQSPVPVIDSEAFANKIWGNMFPPVSVTDIPLELQILVLEVEYMESVVRRGVILNFGPRADGAWDYEVLKGSRGSDDKLALEVFERSPNPDHPFPKISSLAIQNFANLAPRQRLIFSSAKSGQDAQILTRGAISSIYRESSSMAINASVVPGDAGAHIFSLKCGMPNFVGMLLGSRQSIGKETEAVVLGIEEILRFIKDNTGLVIPTETSGRIAMESDPILKERLVAALSNGQYDFTFDLCFLREQCLPKELDQWLVTFQSIFVDRDNFSAEHVIKTGKAVVFGEYVAAFVPVISESPFPINSKDGAVYKHRILLGETIEENDIDISRYEYIEFVGFDSTHSIALFKRPADTRFPLPHTMPFSPGMSEELKASHALYAIGSSDFRSFAFVPFPVLRHANDFAHVAGFAPQRADRFYFQGGGEKYTGGALCALRDGECEVVGFIYGDFDKPTEETLGTALTVEFVLDAVREIACSNNIHSLCAERDQKLATAPAAHSREELNDRKDIVALLVDNYPASPLLFDLLGPDLDIDAATRHARQIVAFMVDETGAAVEGSGATYKNSLIVSDEYVLTSSSFLPKAWILSGTVPILDTSDLTSNVFLSDDNKRVEVRIALLRKFIPEQEIFELLKKGGVTSDVEPLEVVFISREHGYALLRRPSPHMDTAAFGERILRIIPETNMQTNQDIFVVFSKTTNVSQGAKTHIQLVSPGTIIHAASDSPEFMINAFVSEEILGAPIYTNCGEHICLVGIASRAHSYSDLFQTKGFGLSIDFICKEIKGKTGIDLCSNNPQE